MVKTNATCVCRVIFTWNKKTVMKCQFFIESVPQFRFICSTRARAFHFLFIAHKDMEME